MPEPNNKLPGPKKPVPSLYQKDIRFLSWLAVILVFLVVLAIFLLANWWSISHP